MNGYFETSFMPGRSFSSPADFNVQFATWLAIANQRRVRSLHARPMDLIQTDRNAMLRLPPIPPQHGFSDRVRLPRDYYVRVFGNDYSVHPSAIGRMVEVNADLERIQVSCDGRAVADHARSWDNALTVTDPAHVQAAARLREAFQNPPTPPAETDVMLRDLADYDAAFGVEISTGQVLS